MRVSKQLPYINYIIEVLEDDGFECEMGHNSEYEFVYEGLPVKGVTVFTITDGENDFVGYALCSVKDKFNRVTGTKIAFKRAYDAMRTVYDREYMKEIFDV